MSSRKDPGEATFLCFASNGERVIALCKHGAREDAEAWAQRARKGFIKFAEQGAILTPQQVDSIRGGRELRWAVVAGWLRSGGTWSEAAHSQVRLNFAELEPEPAH
jgi:hypothetical protein